MNKKKSIVVVGIVVFAVIVFAVYLAYLAYGTQGGGAGGVPGGADTFNGRIVLGSIQPGQYNDLNVLTDQGCTTDPNTGLSNCVSKFQYNGSIVAFNYEHNMMIDPCLSSGDKVDMNVAANGAVTVKRIYWTGAGS